jgi:hypothetical protein
MRAQAAKAAGIVKCLMKPEVDGCQLFLKKAPKLMHMTVNKLDMF